MDNVKLASTICHLFRSNRDHTYIIMEKGKICVEILELYGALRNRNSRKTTLTKSADNKFIQKLMPWKECGIWSFFLL
jgi:hypothetical protein